MHSLQASRPPLLWMALAICLIVFSTNNVSAGEDKSSPCSTEEINYAHRIGYNARAAYTFGLEIQTIIKEKNIAALFSFIKGELLNGPNKAYSLDKPFDQIFPETWQLEILKEKPPCTPVGWRGFMLGNGFLWYDGDVNNHNKFYISAINYPPTKTLPDYWNFPPALPDNDPSSYGSGRGRITPDRP